MAATSQHLALVAAVAALLTAGPALASGNVVPHSDEPLPTGCTSQVLVNLDGTEPLDINMGLDAPRDWETGIELRIQARKSGASAARVVADEIWTEAYGRVMADQTLGGLVWEMVPGAAEVDVDRAETTLAEITWRFTVKHRTNNDSISS